MDYCLRLGISLKQFDPLAAAGIETIFDLIVASGNDQWYKPIKGIGVKGAQDILDKLDRLFINRLDNTEIEKLSAQRYLGSPVPE